MTDRIPLSRDDANLPCSVCRVGLATIDTVSYEEGQRVTTYRCPLCGHFQHVVSPA
jgi:hypothetical protein